MVKTQLPPFSQYVDELRPRIDAALGRHIELADGCPAGLREAIGYSLLSPGKRLRPTLVLLASGACGGSIEAAMPAACGVEMVHAYSLIHDDLPAMDDDDLRRGRPTCHKAFGEATAILAGDALLAMAFETVADGVTPAALAARCCAELARAAGPCNLVGGQADDQAGSQPDQGMDRLQSIHGRKTGALIRVSLRLGALIAGAGSGQLQALDRYGRRLGLAFQITDDLLDVRSSEQAAGKRVGKDAEQGKLTFPGLLGIEQSARRAEQLIAEACEALRGHERGTGAVCRNGPQGASHKPRLSPFRCLSGLEALALYVLERNR